LRPLSGDQFWPPLTVYAPSTKTAVWPLLIAWPGSFRVQTATSFCGSLGSMVTVGVLSLPVPPEMSTCPLTVTGGRTAMSVRASSGSRARVRSRELVSADLRVRGRAAGRAQEGTLLMGTS